MLLVWFKLRTKRVSHLNWQSWKQLADAWRTADAAEFRLPMGKSLVWSAQPAFQSSSQDYDKDNHSPASLVPTKAARQ